jgi:hypothetical protein
MAVSSPDLKAFLLATPIFGGLSDASLDLLVSMLVERRFDVGATVVAEGEPGRSMFIVHSGELVVSKLADAGRVVPMARLEPGDFFGEMTLIEMQNRSATVAAESPTVLYLRVCDGDAEYQPRALSAAPPRRQSHCRASCFNDADLRTSCGLRRNCDQRNGAQWFSFALREARVAHVSVGSIASF